jgi:hypothetical protein
MTTEEWRRLPLLLRRGDVLRATGWSVRSYTHEVRRGGLLFEGVVRWRNGQVFVRKAVVARVVGLGM